TSDTRPQNTAVRIKLSSVFRSSVCFGSCSLIFSRFATWSESVAAGGATGRPLGGGVGTCCGLAVDRFRTATAEGGSGGGSAPPNNPSTSVRYFSSTTCAGASAIVNSAFNGTFCGGKQLFFSQTSSFIIPSSTNRRPGAALGDTTTSRSHA